MSFFAALCLLYFIVFAVIAAMVSYTLHLDIYMVSIFALLFGTIGAVIPTINLAFHKAKRRRRRSNDWWLREKNYAQLSIDQLTQKIALFQRYQDQDNLAERLACKRSIAKLHSALLPIRNHRIIKPEIITLCEELFELTDKYHEGGRGLTPEVQELLLKLEQVLQAPYIEAP